MAAYTFLAAGEVGAHGGDGLLEAALRVAVALAILIPLVVVATRFAARPFGIRASGRSLRLLESLAIGPHRSISLVEVGGRILVVGATPEHISLLAELTDPEEVQSLLDRAQGEGASPFARILRERRDRREDGKGGERP